MEASASHLEKAQGRLSSGVIAANPSDAPAEFSAASVITGSLAVLEQAQKNVTSAVNLIQLTSGVLGATTTMLTRMKVLATQANNGGLSDPERATLNQEYQALTQQLDMASALLWGRQTVLLDGTFDSITFQIGQGATDTIEVPLISIRANDLGLDVASIDSQENAEEALQFIEAAIATVDNEMSAIGSIRSRLNYQIESVELSQQYQALNKASIFDADVAEALMDTQAYETLMQVSSSMLQQSLKKAQQLLQLVQSVSR